MSLFPEITNEQELELPIQLQPSSDVKVWATSSTHAGVSAKVTVNRVVYDVRFDLHLLDGAWNQSYRRDDGSLSAAYEALIMSRANYYADGKPRDPSWPARQKVLDILGPWFVELLESDAGRELLREAELVDVRREREKIEKELADLDERRAALTARLEAVSS